MVDDPILLEIGFLDTSNCALVPFGAGIDLTAKWKTVGNVSVSRFQVSVCNKRWLLVNGVWGDQPNGENSDKQCHCLVVYDLSTGNHHFPSLPPLSFIAADPFDLKVYGLCHSTKKHDEHLSTVLIRV